MRDLPVESQPAPATPATGTTEESDRRLLLIAPAEYDASVAKGVDRLLLDFDEKGYFEKVVMAFPFTQHNRQVRLAPGLVIHEFGIAGPSLWRRAIAPFHVLRIVAAIAALARRERVAVMRATDPCLSGIVGLIAASLARKPFCVSIHADFDKRHELDAKSGAPRVFGSRRLAVAIERIVLSRADMVLPIRESLIEYATIRGAKRNRIHVIPHGADLTPFTTPASAEALRGLELPVGKHIISFVGRLSRENFVDDVLAAARHLAKSRDDFVLVIAGGGPEQERLHRLVSDERGLSGVVRFAGFLPRDAVAALRQASTVGLCPMGGFSLIEACAAGRPVVAYDAEWHHELVINGETGYLVPEGQTTGLSTAIDRLLNDPAADVMGRNARSLALARHDLDRVVETKRDCYRILIEGRAKV